MIMLIAISILLMSSISCVALLALYLSQDGDRVIKVASRTLLVITVIGWALLFKLIGS